ncbi:probable LRR receptor-like serine/threonine-protein kinase At1g34110 [Selaginella moellendorffii]|uniref:probable LRR receptor-like serine/threonine-protein kinase At1g34110 n=1 Tax=Selaginella moellendorffii TaxID=88036 RepID=UPI000D1CE4D1|nr:probable LRR receptor-like serine/threonine-protein kinase At1g34110 [Selaginella moellendorffii]|eukprot:XP_024527521.1 probable LRR receptor-like serine/threonine-protein kinase At1g34110 [Selaginella moellendorffii]
MARFPKFSSMLRLLNLSINSLTGSVSISGNLGLEFLVLTGNLFSGAIPPELENCSNIRGISLDSNYLTGTIPGELSDLVHLQYLLPMGNRFSGTIPPELGNCSNIRGILLDGNDLTGTIPGKLSNLSHLQQLVLNSNDIGGALPPGLSNCMELIALWLQQNRLSGNSIPASYGKMTLLIFLDVESNNLSREVPAMLQNVSTLQFPSQTTALVAQTGLPCLTNLRAGFLG